MKEGRQWILAHAHSSGQGLLIEKLPDEGENQRLVSTKIISWPNCPVFLIAVPLSTSQPSESTQSQMSSLFFKVSLICASSAPQFEMGGGQQCHARLSCLACKSWYGSDFPWWKGMRWENGKRPCLNNLWIPEVICDFFFWSLHTTGQNESKVWHKKNLMQI